MQSRLWPEQNNPYPKMTNIMEAQAGTSLGNLKMRTCLGSSYQTGLLMLREK